MIAPCKSCAGLLFVRNDSRSQHINPCRLTLQPRRDWRKVLWSKLRSGDGQADITLVRGFAPAHPAHTNLIGFCHHAKVELGVRGLLRVGQDVDVGFDADSSQSSFVASESLLGHISNRIQHSPFALLEALFLWRALSDLHLSKSGPETLSPHFFPRRKRGSSRALRSKKLL